MPRAQRRLSEISGLWTYEGVQQYMVDRLLKEPCFPAPVSVVQDRWAALRIVILCALPRSWSSSGSNLCAMCWAQPGCSSIRHVLNSWSSARQVWLGAGVMPHLCGVVGHAAGSQRTQLAAGDPLGHHCICSTLRRCSGQHFLQPLQVLTSMRQCTLASLMPTLMLAFCAALHRRRVQLAGPVYYLAAALQCGPLAMD